MSLKVWLPLNGDLENLGTSNYTISTFRGTETYDNNGKIGKCFYAHGANTLKILNILPDIYNYSAYSLCAWCYIEAQNTSHTGSGIISGGNWNGQLLNLAMSDWSSDHYTKLRISGSNWTRTYNYNFYKNIWYHIVVCDDGTHTYGYVNGALIGDTAESFIPTSIEGTDICIGGATYYTGMQFFGKINDVRIYDHCLSPLEIKEIAQGLVLHYKLDSAYIESTTNLCGTSAGGWNNSGTCTRTTNDTAILYPPTSSNTYSIRATSDGSMALTCGATTANHPSKTIIASVYVWLDGTQDGSSFYLRSNKTDGSVGNLTYNGNANPSTWPQRQWIRINTAPIATASDATSFYICTYVNKNTEVRAVNGWQIEEKNHITPYTAPGTTRSAETLIQDSSGYNHNGICVNTTISNDSPRYDTCISCIGTTVDSSSNTITGAQYFYCNMDMPATNTITIAWWNKITKYGRGGIFETSSSIQTNTTKGADYNTTAFANWDSTFGIYNGSTRVNIFSNFVHDGEWHHHAITFDGANVKYYLDGILKQTGALTGNLPAWKSFCIGLGKAGGVWRQIQQNISDFRIYCTALLDADIKKLYNTNMSIDNSNNIHIFELKESSKNSILKTGILYGLKFFENNYKNILHYDKTLYTEPDGSTWVRVFHHNDPTTSGYFIKTSDWEHGVYKSADAWYDIEEIVYNLAQYEFMIKQKTTSSAAETKYRWIQNVNPLEATYNDVKPGTVVFNTSSGYTNSSYGGLWRMNSNARMCIANNSSGNWYGALGSWSTYSTNQVPGFPNTNISTGYIDLYIRIYIPTKLIKDMGISSNEFIER